MAKKAKLSIETPHGVFTRSTSNVYDSISVFRWGEQAPFAVWHKTPNGPSSARSTYREASYLGNYPVDKSQYPAEWEVA